MHKYRLTSKKGEGTFSEVLKAQSIKSGKYVAIKCMKNNFDSIDQVNNLREIQALRRLTGHPNIIKLHEVLYDEPTGRLALVFELMDMNLYEAIKGRRHYLPEEKVKHYMYGTLKALDHVHRNGIFHRDVKPENLLLLDDDIKLADLGSCRGIYSRQPYTEYISTRWYRAPECLLTDGYYNFKMDMFAAGSVCFEVVALFPLFPGQNEMDQVQKIHNVLGTPSPELLRKFKLNASHMDFNFPEKKGSGIERLIPHASQEVVSLMLKLLKYDPDERIVARQALKDPFFRELRDAEREAAISPGSSATLQQPGNNTSHPRGAAAAAAAAATAASAAPSAQPQKGGKMSPSSSSASIVQDEPVDGVAAAASNVPSVAAANPAANATSTTTLPSRSVSPTAEERSQAAALPTIKYQDRRKEPGMRPEGQDGSDGEQNENRMMLPPIGGIKGKRDSKSKSKTSTFKSVGNATLQKTTGAPLHPTGGQVSAQQLGGSKGFASTHGPAATTMISTGSMASTSGLSWAGGGTSKPEQTHNPSLRGVMSSDSGGASTQDQRMRSTWAPSQQSGNYASPFKRERELRDRSKRR
mmetsp:Transcript_47057/g.86235  ORF Transcript_47057/g.86235 Transcript_47057/m.86235 type:complete len:583 (-) Transcript_47057:171-1919(-)